MSGASRVILVEDVDGGGGGGGEDKYLASLSIRWGRAGVAERSSISRRIQVMWIVE